MWYRENVFTLSWILWLKTVYEPVQESSEAENSVKPKAYFTSQTTSFDTFANFTLLFPWKRK